MCIFCIYLQTIIGSYIVILLAYYIHGEFKIATKPLFKRKVVRLRDTILSNNQTYLLIALCNKRANYISKYTLDILTERTAFFAELPKTLILMSKHRATHMCDFVDGIANRKKKTRALLNFCLTIIKIVVVALLWLRCCNSAAADIYTLLRTAVECINYIKMPITKYFANLIF